MVNTTVRLTVSKVIPVTSPIVNKVIPMTSPMGSKISKASIVSKVYSVPHATATLPVYHWVIEREMNCNENVRIEIGQAKLGLGRDRREK